MQPAESTRIVEETAQLVTDRYVFPEVGARLGEVLRNRLAEGRYAEADGPAALSALVTEDLQAVNADRHLRLKYHADEIPDLPGHGPLIEMLTRQAALTMGGVARVERLAGNIGYLDLRPIIFPSSMAGEAIIAAMRLIAPTEALIIDLRGCVGGEPGAVALLCTYLFAEPVHLTSMYERDGDRTVQSWTLPYVPGTRFGGSKPVYALTSRTTFSGGEDLAYDLQQRGRAEVIGERTRGGAHPRIGVRVHPHLEVTVPTGRPVNPISGTNWEGTGVVPDVEVPAEEALAVAHRKALEYVRQLDAGSPAAGEARQALDNLAGHSAA